MSLLRLGTLVERIDEAGFDSLWFFNRTGDLPPLLSLLHDTARRTKRVTMGPHVLVAAGMSAAPLARDLLSIQLASKGRLVAQLGIGGRSEALIPDPAEAHAALEALIPRLREAWERERSEAPAESRDVPFSPPPIWLGGKASRTLQRAAALSDGWVPSFITPEEFAEKRRTIEQFAHALGRKDALAFAVQIAYLPPSAGQDAGPREFLRAEVRRHRPDAEPESIYVLDGYRTLCERVEAFAAAGAHHVILVPAWLPTSWHEEIDGLRQFVLPLRS